MPAKLLEEHIIDLIRTDLAQLRDDAELHRMIVDEVRSLVGGQADACDQPQRRLSQLDQQSATLRDHLMSIDPETARSVGLYGQAKSVAEGRSEVEAELARIEASAPALPTVEEKRELIATCVQKIEADPDHNTVRISLCPTLLSPKIAGAGFDLTQFLDNKEFHYR